MEVEFVLRRDDVLAFFDYALDHPPKQLRGGAEWFSWLWLIPIVLLGFHSLLSIEPIIQGDPFSIGAPIFFVTFLFFWLFRRRLKRQFQRRALLKSLDRKADKNAKLLGWQRLSLGPEGISHTTEFNTTTIFWAGIEKIVIARERALIFDSPTSAYVVPQRALASEKAFLEFVETARSYHDLAKEGGAEPGRTQPKPSGQSETGITPRDQID